jgi:hypothetical protein
VAESGARRDHPGWLGEAMYPIDKSNLDVLRCCTSWRSRTS